MKRGLLFGSVSMMALVLAADPQATEKTTSEEAFERLATLKGEWRGEQEGVKINLIYTLTANGSALMEQFRPESGPVMITMFIVDGNHLIATHYCSAKNQPQMATPAITDPQKPLAFSLTHITGLKSPDDWHNTGLTVIQEDDDHLTQEWTYESKGKSGKTGYSAIRELRGGS